jgi:hypothetical protein
MKLLDVLRLLLIFALFPGCSGTSVPDKDELLALLSYPRQVEMTGGFFYPDAGGLTGRVSGIKRMVEPAIFDQLAELSLDLYYDPAVKQADPDFWIGIPDMDPAFQTYCKVAGFELPDTLNQEGYVMEITRKGVILAAQSTTGIFYGLQTLRQLWRQFPEKPGLPCLKITDWPAHPLEGRDD